MYDIVLDESIVRVFCVDSPARVAVDDVGADDGVLCIEKVNAVLWTNGCMSGNIVESIADDGIVCQAECPVMGAHCPVILYIDCRCKRSFPGRCGSSVNHITDDLVAPAC